MRERKCEELLRRILSKQLEVDIELKPTCAPQFIRIAKEMGIKMRYTRDTGIDECRLLFAVKEFKKTGMKYF